MELRYLLMRDSFINTDTSGPSLFQIHLRGEWTIPGRKKKKRP